MKNYKCPNCYREKQTEDFIIMVFCNCCQMPMEEVDRGGENDNQG